MVGYPASSGAIFLSEVMCSGMEQTLSECNIGIAAVPNVIIKCDHNEDVQLVCLPPEIPPGIERCLAAGLFRMKVFTRYIRNLVYSAK